jgi:hypothetical protein
LPLVAATPALLALCKMAQDKDGLVGNYDQGLKQTAPLETHLAFDTTIVKRVLANPAKSPQTFGQYRFTTNTFVVRG